jgi:phosphoribosylanthranilate isomerase
MSEPASQQRVFVKICGITRVQDGLAAEAAGADAVGFIFVPNSRRFIGLERARQISDALGPFVARVGVFQDASLETILKTVNAAGLTVVQLHGHESDAFALEVARVRPVIRAVKVISGETPALPSGTVLVDGPDPGSGQAFDWAGLDRNGADQRVLAGRRWILAGGLTPENVSEAIRTLRPWGVDVSSGVESGPGLKDEERVWRFILAAHRENPKLSTA